MALAVPAFAVVPVFRTVVRSRPLEREYAVPLLLVVVTLLGGLHPLVTAARRARWVEETARQIRIEHALGEHVSIGAADRASVTERAEVVVSLSRLGLVGWPLLALLACGVTLNADLPRWAEVGYVAVVLLGCAGALATSRRRAREARRWLADPLPRNR